MSEPSNEREESMTPSPEDSITRTSNSSYTYSTSALEADIESSSSSFTENTLSMISSPWTTESFDVRTFRMSNTTGTSSLFSWSESGTTAATVAPKSSCSSGIPSPSMNTDCGTTVTILCGGGSFTPSNSIRPLHQQNSKERSDTLSSWTLESYTSSGWLSDVDSMDVVRAKYPWSPSSVMSGTDIYPSSLDTLTSRKGSRVTVATTATLGSGKEKGHVNPMHYVGLTDRPDNKMLDWALSKLNGALMGDALKAMVVV